MIVDESIWIRDALASLALPADTTVLDIGSSTLAFRTEVQPHIDRNVFAPLRERGFKIFHLDAKPEPGVDIVADMTRLDSLDRSFDVVLCTSLLEHVTDRYEVVKNIKNLVAPRGLLLLTVPRRYPIHHDPIDTGFRPTADELIALVGWADVAAREVLTVRHPAHYRGRRFWRRFLCPWQVACILVRRPSS
jgi:SAM-dependent methyltransferase